MKTQNNEHTAPRSGVDREEHRSREEREDEYHGYAFTELSNTNMEDLLCMSPPRR